MLEQNLITSCEDKALFNPHKIIESNYSILEVETPRISVSNSESNDFDDE